MFTKKRFLSFFAFGLIAAVGIVAFFSHMATRPTPANVGQLAPNEQAVSLTAQDNIRISASFFPADIDKAPVILMLHGNGASRRQFQSHVAWLNEAGYAAMAIDFRGHGESQAQAKSFGLFEARDAEAAMLWIKKNHPDSKIGVIGVSLGGAAALLGADGPLPVDAMILKAVYPDIDRAIRNRITVHGGSLLSAIITPMLTYQSPWRYDVWPEAVSPVNGAANYHGAVLVIGGAQDDYTPIVESEELSEAFPGKHWLWIVDNFSHPQLSDLDDAIYRKRVLEFFAENM